MPGQKRKIKKYSDIPYCNNYLVTADGEIVKISTWRFLSVKNGLCAITVNGKRKLLTVPKLVKELFRETS